jgi:hypothetical protein
VTESAGPGKPNTLTAQSISLFKRTPLKKSRTWFTPDVILLTGPAGEAYVLKDFARRPAIARKLWCRWSVARETGAYRRIDGLAGIPRLIVELGPDSFVIEHLAGQPIPRRKSKGIVTLEFFAKLEKLIEEMHSRGVAHADLRRRNILITPGGEPCLIDFETSLLSGRGLVRERLFRAASQIDRLTFLKLKGRYFHKDLSDEEQRELAAAPWHLRIGRFLRKRIYGPISPKRLKKRFRRD